MNDIALFFFVSYYFSIRPLIFAKRTLYNIDIGFLRAFVYSQTSLILTPKGQNWQVTALQRCPYFRGRECMIFGISGTKRTVRNREVSVVIIEVFVRRG